MDTAAPNTSVIEERRKLLVAQMIHADVYALSVPEDAVPAVHKKAAAHMHNACVRRL